MICCVDFADSTLGRDPVLLLVAICKNFTGDMYLLFPCGSQMPRNLISGMHVWIHKIPTVPIYYLGKPQPREQTWEDQRGKVTLSSLTLVSFFRGIFLYIVQFNPRGSS